MTYLRTDEGYGTAPARGLVAFMTSVVGGVVALASWVIEGLVTSQPGQLGFLMLNVASSAVACVSGLSYVLHVRDSKLRQSVAWLILCGSGAWLAFTLVVFVAMRVLPDD